jgi:hypothetical protein
MKIISALAVVAVLTCQAAAAAQGPSATPVKRPTLIVCNKRADARHLTGAARAQFIKDCTEGKT